MLIMVSAPRVSILKREVRVALLAEAKAATAVGVAVAIIVSFEQREDSHNKD